MTDGAVEATRRSAHAIVQLCRPERLNAHAAVALENRQQVLAPRATDYRFAVASFSQRRRSAAGVADAEGF